MNTVNWTCEKQVSVKKKRIYKETAAKNKKETVSHKEGRRGELSTYKVYLKQKNQRLQQLIYLTNLCNFIAETDPQKEL